MKDGHVFARKLAAVSLTFLVEQAPRVLEAPVSPPVGREGLFACG